MKTIFGRYGPNRPGEPDCLVVKCLYLGDWQKAVRFAAACCASYTTLLLGYLKLCVMRNSFKWEYTL